MGSRRIKLNCDIDSEDYMTLEMNLGSLGVDIFNNENGLMENTGIVLNNEQTKELVKFLKDYCISE